MRFAMFLRITVTGMSGRVSEVLVVATACIWLCVWSGCSSSLSYTSSSFPLLFTAWHWRLQGTPCESTLSTLRHWFERVWVWVCFIGNLRGGLFTWRSLHVELVHRRRELFHPNSLVLLHTILHSAPWAHACWIVDTLLQITFNCADTCSPIADYLLSVFHAL